MKCLRENDNKGLIDIRRIVSQCVCCFTIFLLIILPSDQQISIFVLKEKEPHFKITAPEPEFPYTQEEIDMISAVVMHEVGYCSRESKIAVTNVILNRLKDGRFGDSVYEVLHAKNQFGAIQNYYDKTYPPDEECVKAVMDALKGEDNSKGAIYYCNPKYIYDPYAKWWFDTLDLLFELDGQRFYAG